jgi:hypothetical protein
MYQIECQVITLRITVGWGDFGVNFRNTNGLERNSGDCIVNNTILNVV